MDILEKIKSNPILAGGVLIGAAVMTGIVALFLNKEEPEILDAEWEEVVEDSQNLQTV